MQFIVASWGGAHMPGPVAISPMLKVRGLAASTLALPHCVDGVRRCCTSVMAQTTPCLPTLHCFAPVDTGLSDLGDISSHKALCSPTACRCRPQ